jgi:hypothetical protein
MPKVKVIHEFELPDKQIAYDQLVNDLKYVDACNEVTTSIRAKLKWGEDEWLKVDGVVEYLEDIRTSILDKGLCDG